MATETETRMTRLHGRHGANDVVFYGELPHGKHKRKVGVAVPRVVLDKLAKCLLLGCCRDSAGHAGWHYEQDKLVACITHKWRRVRIPRGHGWELENVTERRSYGQVIEPNAGPGWEPWAWVVNNATRNAEWVRLSMQDDLEAAVDKVAAALEIPSACIDLTEVNLAVAAARRAAG